MLLRDELSALVEQDRVASTRVVPVPFSDAWCIDIVVRTPLEVGSTTDTVAAAPDDDSGELRTFPSIDAAAGFLKEVGIGTFVVDMDDALSFTAVDEKGLRVVERTMRIGGGEIQDIDLPGHEQSGRAA